MFHTCRRTCPLALGAVLLALVSLSVAASPPPQSQLVTFPNPGPDVLAELAAQGWDIWQVTSTEVTAQLSPSQVNSLRLRGVDVAPVGEGLQYTVQFPACYRTFREGVKDLEDWADAYPELTELINAGSSWETVWEGANRPIWALRITNEANVEPKPAFLLVALHHAREIVTPEVALNLAELLLTGYGEDAEITWLVDNREILIVPFVNPDGHFFAEFGNDWRKNTDDGQSTCAGSSPPNSYGIDLNRNYDHQWGTIGSSSNPCNLTYRGTGGFSEPETKAVRDLVQTYKPSLVISLHSYSDLVLYPWGYTYGPAPDDAGLRNGATVLASFNGYTPQQSSDLYPTSGDTCDWVYGVEDTPCYTFEIGGGAAENYFWPVCDVAHEQWLENRDALLHAIKLAGDPYRLAEAPIVKDIKLAYRGRQVTVWANLDQEAVSPEPPVGGEVFVGQIGSPGTGTPLLASDQTFSTAVETMTAMVDLAGVEGRRPLYILGFDGNGEHGPPGAMYFEPCPDVTADSAVGTDDVAQLAELWRLRSGDTGFDPLLDLNGDQQINILDIGQMVSHWGMNCTAD